MVAGNATGSWEPDAWKRSIKYPMETQREDIPGDEDCFTVTVIPQPYFPLLAVGPQSEKTLVGEASRITSLLI